MNTELISTQEELQNEAVSFIRSKVSEDYEIGIILGTGLGGLVKEIQIDHTIEYTEIPNFPVSTVESHHGRLIFGTLAGKKIVAMQGRFHFYEGYTHGEVTFPVFVLHKLGIKFLIVSNACGALNPAFRRTDLMLIRSHINLHFTTPFKGVAYNKNESFIDHYTSEMLKLAEETAIENKIPVQKGVYLSVQGPNLETRTEYKMTRKMGGDVVGMSTIPEILVASSMLGLKCLGLSIITDEGFPGTLKVAELKDILEAAAIAEPKMTLLTRKIIEKL